MDDATRQAMQSSGLMDAGQSIASHPAAPGVGPMPNARAVIMGGLMGRNQQPEPGAPQSQTGNAQQYISSHQAGGETGVEHEGGDSLPTGDLLTAQVALRRGGASPELISDLVARAPDQAVQLGQLLSERQSGADAKINRQDTRISELERALTDGRNGGAGTPAAGAADRQPQAPDLKAATAAFVKATGGEESEIGPALETFAQAIRPTQTQAAPETQPQQQSQEPSRAEAWAFDSLVTSARSELSGSFPELATPAIYAEVEQRMSQLLPLHGNLSPQAQVRAAMKDATTLVLADLGVVSGGSPQDATRANGSQSQPPRSRGRGGPSSGGQRSGKYAGAQKYLDAHNIRG